VKDTFFSVKKTLNLGDSLLTIDKPMVMGIINLTPDSFYTGSRINTEKELITTCETMTRQGVDIIDLGAYSTRPGADEISTDEEIARLKSGLNLLVKHFPDTLFSVDTFRSEVAEFAIQQGAKMINDVSGLTDTTMAQVVAKHKVPYVLMHTQGTPKVMQNNPQYKDVSAEIYAFFKSKIDELKTYGVHDIILDPGFGFGKTVEHNYQLLQKISCFRALGHPVLAGVSRKSMIYKPLEITPDEALNGTTALHTFALLEGVQILRVHDIKEAVETIRLISMLTK
jgi:dihydropteroate synthase